MFEYYIIEAHDGDLEGLERRLNILAGEGWHVISSVMSMVILEREKTPEIEERVTDISRTVTYTWPNYVKKPSD